MDPQRTTLRSLIVREGFPRAAAAAVVAVLVACITACSAPTAPVPERERLASYFAAGEFVYGTWQPNSNASRCVFVPPQRVAIAVTSDTGRLDFRCSEIIVGLRASATVPQFSVLLPGTSVLDLSLGGGFPTILLQVSAQSERAALLTLLRHASVAYANPNYLVIIE